MRYDLANPLHRQQLTDRLRQLLDKQTGHVELRELRPLRTLSQNAYLHTLIAYLALQLGEQPADVKREYYKLAANPQTFVLTRPSPITGRPVLRLRSTAALTTGEMTLTIERFRDWAARTAGIYLPSPDEHRRLQDIELQLSRAPRYT